jgi:hypothetical protein
VLAKLKRLARASRCQLLAANCYSLIWQAPGPPGIAQPPAAAVAQLAIALDPVPPFATANRDNCCSRFVLWHSGQAGLREPWTSASNRFRQSLQM